MSQPEFKFCSFRENVIKKALFEQPLPDTVFVFPTENNKRIAILESQKNWDFSNVKFLTMEALKEQLFFTAKPLLKEEKRTLAFFASLTEDDKIKFSIHSYFNSIQLAQQFFDLWEEFNEEWVQENIESTFSVLDAELLDWQSDTFQRLKSIKRQYQATIQDRGFEDVIFTHRPERINMDELAPFQRVVFVNQFYYTKLEKAIIRSLLAAGKHVTIFYQLPAELVNTAEMEISKFSLPDLSDYRTDRIHVIECKNDFSMLTALLQEIDRSQLQHLVDVSFLKKNYSAFLAIDQFNLGSSLRFEHTSVYRFFRTLHNLVSELTWEPERKKRLLPLQSLLDAVLSDDFFPYVLSAQGAEQLQPIREQTLAYLYELIGFDYKYLDLEQEFFQIKSGEGAAPLLAVLRLLKHTLQIASIGDLIDCIDAENGFHIRQIITPVEARYSDLLASFYRLLSDFATIEKLGLITDWSTYFASGDDPMRQAKTAGGILRLFIDYMKPRRVSYTYSIEKAGRIEITELMDTRNIEYNKVAVLNVVEGKLPSARQIPFLFTERQRKLLGLKTFEDVQLWEKYYFLRLVLNSKEVYLFTQKNTDENIAVSPFLEEVALYFPKEKVEYRQVEDRFYAAALNEFLEPKKDYQVQKERSKKPEFYAIPLEIQRDFAGGRIDLNYYALKTLRDHPFAYYIRHLIGAEERVKSVSLDFSDKLIGTMVHDILMTLWNSLEQVFAAPLFGYDFAGVERKFVDAAISKIAGDRLDYYFRIPHNHTFIYFEHVLRPLIREGVEAFLAFLHEMGLSNQRIDVIPEREFSTASERNFRTVLSPAENDLGLQVRLGGRADLRIEQPDASRYLIFDYKTGKTTDAMQLLIYELFYYALDKPELAEKVSSYFIQILDRKQEELGNLYRFARKRFQSRAEMRAHFIANLQEIFAKLKEKGFAPPEKKSQLEQMADIFRIDLFLASKIESTAPNKD